MSRSKRIKGSSNNCSSSSSSSSSSADDAINAIVGKYYNLLVEIISNNCSSVFIPTSACGIFFQNPLKPQEISFVPFNDETDTTNNLLICPPYFYSNILNGTVKILSSCNGLFCFSHDDHARGVPETHFFVCNPTTRKFNWVSVVDNKNPAIIFAGVTLAYDPSKWPHYRVVFVFRANFKESGHDRLVFAIYSPETKLPRLTGRPYSSMTVPAWMKFDSGVYWNGSIHWICVSGQTTVSLRFDIENSSLERLPFPSIPNGQSESRWLRHFGESRDHLHLIESYGPRMGQLFVHEMKRDYSEWFLKYRVDLEPVLLSGRFPLARRKDMQSYAFEIICLVRGETEQESFLVLSLPGGAIIRYGINDHTVKKLSGSNKSFQSGCNNFQYVESLACV